MRVVSIRIPELGGEGGGVSHQTAYVGDCSSHVFSLMHLEDELSLKEMRIWGQSKILEYRRWKLGAKSL